MKVIYKKTIAELLDEEVKKAYRQGKKIESFILTKEEMSELNQMKGWTSVGTLYGRKFNQTPSKVFFDGIPVVEEDAGSEDF